MLAGLAVASALVLTLGRSDPAIGVADRDSGSDPAVAVPPPAPRPAPPRATPALPAPALGPSVPIDERPLWPVRDQEVRDSAWATPQEAAIRARLDELLAGMDGQAVAVPQLECRETRCRLAVSGSDEGAVRRFVESLQSPAGFAGDAAALALEKSDSVTGADGQTRYAVVLSLVYTR